MANVNENTLMQPNKREGRHDDYDAIHLSNAQQHVVDHAADLFDDLFRKAIKGKDLSNKAIADMLAPAINSTEIVSKLYKNSDNRHVNLKIAVALYLAFGTSIDKAIEDALAKEIEAERREK